MLNAKVKAETLKEVVELLHTLVDEVKMNFGKDGLSVKAVDPSHVAMIELSLNKSSFEEYKSSGMELAIELEKLKEVLKLAKPGDIVKLTYDEDKNKLIVEIAAFRRFIPLLDIGSISDAKVPTLTHTAKAVINLESLRQGIRGTESVSSHLMIEIKPDVFKLEGESEQDKVEMLLYKDKGEVEIEAKDTAKSMYALDYFANVVKAISSAQKVTLNIGKDYPLKMEFEFAEGNGIAKFLLAPRMPDTV
ncbi:MAG: DNA polymerase sliding clamp [Thermoplasmata archaeon]